MADSDRIGRPTLPGLGAARDEAEIDKGETRVVEAEPAHDLAEQLRVGGLVLASGKQLAQAGAQARFSELDKNKDNVVDQSELGNGPRPMLRHADQNKDGKVTRYGENLTTNGIDLVNEDDALDETAQVIQAIIQAEKCRVRPRSLIL